MASNKKLNFQPAAIASAAANILNCAISSLSGPVGLTATQPYVLINHVRIVNTTAAAITVTLWKGGSNTHAAGTEWYLSNCVISSTGSGSNFIDIYPMQARLDSGDFIIASASATGMTMDVAGEIGFS